MGEAGAVLEQKSRWDGERGAYFIPVDRIGQINIEICDHRSSPQRHVGRGREVGLFHILQLVVESLLWRATRTGIPLQRSLVDHDRKRESGMSFRLGHHQFRGLINAVVRAVPVDNHSVNSAADHVRDLAMDLLSIGGAVTYVHVVRSSEPQQQMGVDLGRRAGIEQAVNVDFAYVAGSGIPIALSGKAVGRTCVVSRREG